MADEGPRLTLQRRVDNDAHVSIVALKGYSWHYKEIQGNEVAPGRFQKRLLNLLYLLF